METTCAWPPTVEQRGHLALLAELIRAGGAERFASVPLVGADDHDFPDKWVPTMDAVARLVYRMFWLVYLDPALEIEDARPSGYDEKMLRASEIEIGSVADGRVTFVVASIGNDNVAGLLSHKIGEAYLELVPKLPFREAPTGEADPTHGSIAACYLGLGVLVANSSLYARHASRFAGNLAVTENRVEQVGGLSIADATFLLAVQDVLRDDHQSALETLLPPQAEWFERWVEVLEDHEDELRALLELPGSIDQTLTRAERAPEPPSIGERDLTKFNAGELTFRVPVRARRWLAGGLVGLGVAVVGRLILGEAVWLLAIVPAGAVVGLLFKKGGYQCADPSCRNWMLQELAVCPGCGGEIAGSIKHANDRLDRLDEIEKQRQLASP